MGVKKEETLGQRIGRLREAGGLTQEQLADKAGVQVSSLRNWEYDHRRPRAEATLLLAQALGVTVEALLHATTTRAARAEVPDPPGLRALKRAWDRATEDERQKFLEFVRGSSESESDQARRPKPRQRRKNGG